MDGPGNFVDDIVRADLESGRVERVVTRFPPEPNGYLHIGHAKAICLSFGLAERHGGRCNLRFDDTNPEAESVEFVESIKSDIRWLGFDWGPHEHYASDHFQQLYEWAEMLIRTGKAYVDSQTEGELRAARGDFFRAGSESPYRNRSAEESLDLFRRMRRGELPEGSHVLRARIDMESKDVKLRDPLMYRIKKAHHHRTGDAWPIYPMYDWAHGQSDLIEGITHSVCSLEFQNHRPLYDWFLEQIGIDPRPRQIEFARLSLDYTVLSKRKLQQLVAEKRVSGWDDPRMPTLAGMRRRGYPPEAIRTFCERIGVSRRDSVVDVSLLEHALREELNARSPRRMAVLRPLRVVLENYPEDEVDELQVPNHPTDPSFGTRKVPFSRVVYVERDDYLDDPPRKWHRLGPGREVRLRYAALVTCREVVRDAEGHPIELRCTWDPRARGGDPADGRKVRGTLHWVSAAHAVDAEVRLYDRLFKVENPLDERLGPDFLAHLNPGSLSVVTGAKVEPGLAAAAPLDRFQLERLGYFCADARDHAPGRPVFNRTIELKESWSKPAPDSR